MLQLGKRAHAWIIASDTASALNERIHPIHNTLRGTNFFFLGQVASASVHIVGAHNDGGKPEYSSPLREPSPNNSTCNVLTSTEKNLRLPCEGVVQSVARSAYPPATPSIYICSTGNGMNFSRCHWLFLGMEYLSNARPSSLSPPSTIVSIPSIPCAASTITKP